MSIEIQVRADSMQRLIVRTLRERFRTTCAPRAPGLSLDHVEVVDSGVSIAQVNTRVDVRAAADVFTVTDADLYAHPNDTPAGALTPVVRVNPTVQVAMRSNQLVLSADPLHLPPFPDVPLPSASQDLTPLLAVFEQQGLVGGDVAAGDGVVAARIAPAAGPAASRLAPGDQWATFVSRSAVEQMIRKRIATPISEQIPVVGGSLHVGPTVNFGPAGPTPNVRVEIGMRIALLDLPLSQATVNLDCALALLPGSPAPGSPARLRIGASWDLTLILPPLPGLEVLPLAGKAIEVVAEEVLAPIVADMVTDAIPGMVHTGDRSFYIDVDLPPLALGAATLTYDTLSALGDGIRLGGRVLIAALGTPDFSLDVSQFGLPYRIQICRELAKSGSGNPSMEPPNLLNTRVYAQAAIDGAGTFCAMEMLTPGNPYAFFVHTTSPLGTRTEEVTISADMIYANALAITEELRFVVRTARGVRYVDLGVAPPPIFGPNGELKVRFDAYIPNCLMYEVSRHGRSGMEMDKDDFKLPPLELPEWTPYLEVSRGVVVKVVELSGLAAHELVRFRSRTHRIDAIADSQGRLALPVLLPLRVSGGPARIERANGRSLAGHVRVQTAAFERYASLPGVLAAAPTVTPSGRVAIHTKLGGRAVTYGIDRLGTLVQQVAPLSGHNRAAVESSTPSVPLQEVALNPQPLPPEPPPEELGTLPEAFAHAAGLSGVRRILAVPGFASYPIGVAELEEGDYLLLDLANGGVRVAGTFAGPIGAIDIAAGFGVSASANGIAVLRRIDRPVAPDVAQQAMVRLSRVMLAGDAPVRGPTDAIGVPEPSTQKPRAPRETVSD